MVLFCERRITLDSAAIFDIYYNNDNIHSYIAKAVRQRSKRPEDWEDYTQDCWLAISCCPVHASTDFLKSLIDKCVYSAFWQNYKEYLIGAFD